MKSFRVALVALGLALCVTAGVLFARPGGSPVAEMAVNNTANVISSGNDIYLTGGTWDWNTSGVLSYTPAPHHITLLVSDGTHTYNLGTASMNLSGGWYGSISYSNVAGTGYFSPGDTVYWAAVWMGTDSENSPQCEINGQFYFQSAP